MVCFLFICNLSVLVDVARMSSNWSPSVTKFIAHIVGSYQNEHPLADKFLEFGKHSYTEYEYYLKKQLCIFPFDYI